MGQNEIPKKEVPMLSTGIPSTLENWVNLCIFTFGIDSKPTVFMKEKMDKQGKDEYVIADEMQLLELLSRIFTDDANMISSELARRERFQKKLQKKEQEEREERDELDNMLDFQ
ncbi:hypothetical protein [Psychrobacillus antarcticus]|uniref:hypothetical protein n=1 Tax=Psychrobacillus antarcticus TaxID=2879115 RepID=UPI002407A286|nr:hypothetical protein [Psychrobacillus antarcticus]